MNFYTHFYLQINESKKYPLLDGDGNIILDRNKREITSYGIYRFEAMHRFVNDLPSLPPPRKEWDDLPPPSWLDYTNPND